MLANSVAAAGVREERELLVGDRGVYVSHYRADSDKCVVIAPPLFEEHPRTRKALVNIARDINSVELNAIRFDYYGTGLSDGESCDISVRSAVESLKYVLGYCSRNGFEKIICLGFRFGGYIALESRKFIDARLILWEPIFDLKKYFNNLVNIAIGNQLIVHGTVVRDKNNLIRDLNERGSIFIDGYDISAHLYDQFMTSEIYCANMLVRLKDDLSVILWRDKKMYEELKAKTLDTEYLHSTKLAWDSIRYVDNRPGELFNSTIKRII